MMDPGNIEKKNVYYLKAGTSYADICLDASGLFIFTFAFSPNLYFERLDGFVKRTN